MAKGTQVKAGEFKVLVVDTNKLGAVLWGNAFARATLEEMVVVKEGGFYRVADRHPTNPRQAVLDLANEYFRVNAQGVANKQAQGPVELRRYLEALAQRQADFRAQQQETFARVDAHNASQNAALTSALKVANGVKFLGVVGMATVSAVAAITVGGATATATGLIYIGYKVAAGAVPAVMEETSAWDAAKGVAIGSYQNGQVSYGLAPDMMLEKLITGLSGGFLKIAREQIANQTNLVVDLQNAVKRQTAQLTKDVGRYMSRQGIAAAQAKYAQLVAQRGALAVEQEVLKRSTAKAAAGQVFKTGIPLVFLAADVMGAYADWAETNAKI
jgi:hypothetical protein